MPCIHVRHFAALASAAARRMGCNVNTDLEVYAQPRVLLPGKSRVPAHSGRLMSLSGISIQACQNQYDREV